MTDKTKELYETFWNETKNPFINSIMKAREKNKLNTSQRQAVIKLKEEKERDTRFIKNWCPIFLLNVDYKIIAKALATRLKKTAQANIFSTNGICEKQVHW